MNQKTNQSLSTSDIHQNSAIDIQQLTKDLEELSSEENLLDDTQDKENQQKFSNQNHINLRKETHQKSSELQKLKQENYFYKKENEELRQDILSLKTDLINRYDELKQNNQTMCNKFELKSQSALDEQRIKYESQIERLKDQVKNLEDEAIERKKNFRERNQQLYNMVLKLEKEKQEILEKNIKLIHNRFSSRYMDETLDSTLNTKTNKTQFNTLQHEPKMSTKCHQLVNEYRSMFDNNSQFRSRNLSIQPQTKNERTISYDQPFSSKIQNINCLRTDDNSKKNIYDQYLTIDSLQMSKDNNEVENILPKRVLNVPLQNNNQKPKDYARTPSIPLHKSMSKNTQIKNTENPPKSLSIPKKEIKKKSSKKCTKNQITQSKQRVPIYTKINK